jgi:hypothetical protein
MLKVAPRYAALEIRISLPQKQKARRFGRAFRIRKLGCYCAAVAVGFSAAAVADATVIFPCSRSMA